MPTFLDEKTMILKTVLVYGNKCYIINNCIKEIDFSNMTMIVNSNDFSSSRWCAVDSSGQ